MGLRRKIALWICPELLVKADNRQSDVFASEQDIIKLAEAYSKHTQLTLSTIGSYAVRDGKFFVRISKGGSCTLKTAARLAQYFSDNWPEDLAWPKDIYRPTPTKKEAA